MGVGAVSITGNARNLTLSMRTAAEYRVTGWIFGGRATANYGESRIDSTGSLETTVADASLFLRGDRRFTPKLAAYALAGVEADHPKSIEARFSEELGLSYAWIDRATGENKLLVRTDLGFRVSEEYRFQYFPVRSALPGDYPEMIYSPRLGGAFRFEVIKRALFTEDLEVLSDVSESRWFVNSSAKLTMTLLESLGVGVGFTVNYDSKPPPPKISWDTRLAVTLEYLL